MKYKITSISDGGDFEVSQNKGLIATCGTEEMAKRLVRRLAAADKMFDVLKSVRMDCLMALTGEWDKSDEGFRAMKESAVFAAKRYSDSFKRRKSQSTEAGRASRPAGILPEGESSQGTVSPGEG